MRRRIIAAPKLAKAIDLRPKKVYRPVRAHSQARFDDAALDRFHANRDQGRCYTADEIAAACGVSPQRVSRLEQQALRKVREALGVEIDELSSLPSREFFLEHPRHFNEADLVYR